MSSKQVVFLLLNGPRQRPRQFVFDVERSRLGSAGARFVKASPENPLNSLTPSAAID